MSTTKYWPKWQELIQSELNSLAKREVFGPIVQTPNGIKPVGYKWIFVRKRNEKNKYKGIKHALWHKDFLKVLTSTMKRHTHQLWMQ